MYDLGFLFEFLSIFLFEELLELDDQLANHPPLRL